ncbi:hypothetical protein RUM44_010332 [Polyplax serrata]|uniref:Cadherin domain-containing protein n=1 Tax=Polyplax serrata TaxID=468196 RepID=A0ABR1AV87_POLSC
MKRPGDSGNKRACQFYPYGDYLRFVRVTEKTPLEETILEIDVYPRHNLTIQPVDRIEDASYFGLKNINNTTIGVVLLRPLDELVDNDNPQNVLKFRIVCDYGVGMETISSYMSVTVYVEDVNDHAPYFLDVPYHVTVDELTPVGLTLFQGIHAVDRDKPNTPNSDIHYSIVGGNHEGRFALENSHRAALVLKKSLDYDSGNREYTLKIMASDRGIPPRNTTVPLYVKVSDNDDLNPRFSRDVYRTQIPEFYPITGNKIHKELRFKPAILAYDADLEINSPVKYEITAGNERGFFHMDPFNGSLFLEKEVDLEREISLMRNVFILQIQASQVDNPSKTGYARVEVKVLDINDNVPEFEVDLYNISIVENLPNGFSVLQVVATDRDQDENGEFTFQLEDRSRAFSIDPKSGWLTVKDQTVLDREKHPCLSMKVYAREKVPSVIPEYKSKTKSPFVSVEVTLIDANDNNPTFLPSNLYEFHIPGDARIGHVVGQVKTSDPDFGRNGQVSYNFQYPSTSNISGKLNSFVVDPTTGIITVNEYPLEQGRYALFIEAADQPENPSERRFSLAVVTIEVLKVGKNDLVPDFLGAPYEFWVGGDVAVGTSVGQVRVTEAVDKTQVIYDLLHSYPDGVPFAVEETSGVISVVNKLHKFDRSLYDFEAVVTDGKELTIVTNLTIHVVDPEEYKQPVIRENNKPIELRVRENMPRALVGQIVRPYESPYTNTSAWWKSLRFTIANEPDVANKFAISSDGTIYTQKGLDREERELYHLTILVESVRRNRRGAKIYQVTVLVEDENDNPPVFELPRYEGHILENSPGGTLVTLNRLIKATDADSGVNAQFKYSIRGEGSDIFVIDQTTGKLFFRKNIAYVLDREEKESYSLSVFATDKGNLSSEAKLNIYIDDVNDNPPKFLQMIVMRDEEIEVVDSNDNKPKHRYAPTGGDLESIFSDNEQSGSSLKPAVLLPPVISLPENISVGTSIIRLLAHDRDTNYSVTYRVIKETITSSEDTRETSLTARRHFLVHSTTGEVTIADKLSPETEYHLTVSALDSGGYTDNITLRIYVKDVNDHSPVFSKPSYDFDLVEGVYSELFLGKVEAIDADYGNNANVTYTISSKLLDDVNFPFRVSLTRGEIYVYGNIDREYIDSYAFEILARDNAVEGPRLSASVLVEVRIIDINDNPPEFFYFDQILEVPRYELENLDADSEEGQETQAVPVYYATVNENSAIGIPVIKITANDSDFTGNGNGLFLFDIVRRKNNPTYFEIDSKEGVVTITNRLDYELNPLHNVTIIASDLGKPSLTSTALLMVSILDNPEEPNDGFVPIFDNRYYEIEVEENSFPPLELLTLNVSERYRGFRFRYSIVPGLDSGDFSINPANGTLTLLVKPDRETKVKYELKVRVDRIKKGRGMISFIYPPSENKMADVGSDEVKIIVRVKDLNDNTPKFKHHNRPTVAVVPRTANYGHEIIRLQATDLDEGLNGEIRYYILGRGEDSQKFTIDPVTGQIRSVVSFAKDAGKVFGFDVKAVDRRGADLGRSSIANVFVYVLDNERQVVMVARSKAATVERNIGYITSTLSNITGLEVGARKIEPRMKSDQDDGRTTDIYLYAINPSMNVLVDMNTLHQMLLKRSPEIKRSLDSFRILDFAYADDPLPTSPRAQKSVLSVLEIAVIVLGCVVFIGAMASAICVGCMQRGKKRKRRKTYPAPEEGFTLAKAIVKPSHLFPASAFHEGLCHGDTTDTYVDLHSNKSSLRGSKRFRHDIACYRSHRHGMQRRPSQIKPPLMRSVSNSHFGRLETSITSLHSSGKDSGITEGGGGVCPCGHSSSPSSGDSTNGSYEDSLKSLHRGNGTNLDKPVSNKRESFREKAAKETDIKQVSLKKPPPPPPPLPQGLLASLISLR